MRGCIGFVAPKNGIHQSVVEAAVAAATRDPRFSPVSLEQLSDIRVEVTILSEPKRVDPRRHISDIKIGRDCLLVRGGAGSGLLLPQVAEEYGWSPQQFLERTCEKAGLARDAWRSKSIEVLKFSGDVLRESQDSVSQS